MANQSSSVTTGDASAGKFEEDELKVSTDYLIVGGGIVERAHLVKANIYPVPDINQPFLGLHLTRVASGEVYAGPTTIPALGRENYGILKVQR